MTLALSLTITRTALSLADLVITNDPAPGIWIESVGAPSFSQRLTYAPPSDYIPGNKLLAKALDASSLPVVLYAKASTSAALATLKASLEAAVNQFAYTVTLTVDGVSQSWAADPTWPNWGDVDDGMAAAKAARALFSIPVNPA